MAREQSPTIDHTDRSFGYEKRKLKEKGPKSSEVEDEFFKNPSAFLRKQLSNLHKRNRKGKMSLEEYDQERSKLGIAMMERAKSLPGPLREEFREQVHLMIGWEWFVQRLRGVKQAPGQSIREKKLASGVGNNPLVFSAEFVNKLTQYVIKKSEKEPEKIEELFDHYADVLENVYGVDYSELDITINGAMAQSATYDYLMSRGKRVFFTSPEEDANKGYDFIYFDQDKASPELIEEANEKLTGEMKFSKMSTELRSSITAVQVKNREGEKAEVFNIDPDKFDFQKVPDKHQDAIDLGVSCQVDSIKGKFFITPGLHIQENGRFEEEIFQHLDEQFGFSTPDEEV